VLIVADADRERALAVLRGHYADGRLTVDDLQRRVELVTRARSTGDLRRALANLPNGIYESDIRPRLVSLAQSPTGSTVIRRVRRLVFAVVLAVAWTMETVALLAGLLLAAIVTQVTAAVAAVFAVAWLAVTGMSAWAWRGSGRRARAR
jgi:hypothetical protein